MDVWGGKGGGEVVRLGFAFGSKDVGNETEGGDEDKPKEDGVAVYVYNVSLKFVVGF